MCPCPRLAVVVVFLAMGSAADLYQCLANLRNADEVKGIPCRCIHKSNWAHAAVGVVKKIRIGGYFKEIGQDAFGRRNSALDFGADRR